MCRDADAEARIESRTRLTLGEKTQQQSSRRRTTLRYPRTTCIIIWTSSFPGEELEESDLRATVDRAS